MSPKLRRHETAQRQRFAFQVDFFAKTGRGRFLAARLRAWLCENGRLARTWAKAEGLDRAGATLGLSEAGPEHAARAVRLSEFSRHPEKLKVSGFCRRRRQNPFRPLSPTQPPPGSNGWKTRAFFDVMETWGPVGVKINAFVAHSQLPAHHPCQLLALLPWLGFRRLRNFRPDATGIVYESTQLGCVHLARGHANLIE